MPRSADTETALATSDLCHERSAHETAAIPGLVGMSKRMLDVYDMVTRVAPTSSTVLIQGKPGPEKELRARAFHSRSRRGDHPFVPVDCSALAESLLESELFGHVKGAFTRALPDRRGLLWLRGRGTG